MHEYMNAKIKRIANLQFIDIFNYRMLMLYYSYVVNECNSTNNIKNIQTYVLKLFLTKSVVLNVLNSLNCLTFSLTQKRRSFTISSF